MTSHALTMQCSGHPMMLLGYFHIMYKVLLHSTLNILPNQGLFRFSFLSVPHPLPECWPVPLVWWVPLEQGGQPDSQDCPTPSQPRGKRW